MLSQKILIASNIKKNLSILFFFIQYFDRYFLLRNKNVLINALQHIFYIQSKSVTSLQHSLSCWILFKKKKRRKKRAKTHTKLCVKYRKQAAHCSKDNGILWHSTLIYLGHKWVAAGNQLCTPLPFRPESNLAVNLAFNYSRTLHWFKCSTTIRYGSERVNKHSNTQSPNWLINHFNNWSCNQPWSIQSITQSISIQTTVPQTIPTIIQPIKTEKLKYQTIQTPVC